MKKARIYILVALALGCSIAVSAQKKKTLTKEITVETDFVPVEKKATKSNTLPAVEKTTVPKKTLNYSEWVRSVEIPQEVNKFEPYAYKTTYPFVNSKGYVDLGLGTQLNILGSAGYRFIEKEDMLLNAWLQHNSTWLGKNSSPRAVANPQKQKINDNTLGVNFAQKLLTGTLKLSAFGHYDYFNYYGYNEVSAFNNANNQSIKEFAVKADWESFVTETTKTHLSAQVVFDHFSYSRYLNNADKGLHENHLYAKVNAEASIGGNMSLGIDGTGEIVRYTRLRNEQGVASRNTWMALVKGSPYIRYNDKSGLSVKAGLNVDFSAKDGKKIRISPNVRADYKVLDRIILYADLNGGKKINYLSDFHLKCRYLAPNEVLGSSYTTADLEVGAKVGPFEGFYARPFLGYGVFKNEVLPVLEDMDVSTESGVATLYPIPLYVITQKLDIKGWKAGLELGYKYNELIDFNATVQATQQDKDKGYATGLDRAKLLIDAQVKVTPIEPLAITLGYNMRSKRAYYSRYEVVGAPPVVTWRKTDLKDVCNLSLQASYKIDKMFTVFVHGNNLLNMQWDEYIGMGAQKMSAMAGVNILF